MGEETLSISLFQISLLKIRRDHYFKVVTAIFTLAFPPVVDPRTVGTSGAGREGRLVGAGRDTHGQCLDYRSAQ